MRALPVNEDQKSLPLSFRTTDRTSPMRHHRRSNFDTNLLASSSSPSPAYRLPLASSSPRGRRRQRPKTPIAAVPSVMTQPEECSETFGGPGSLFDPDTHDRMHFKYGMLVVARNTRVDLYKTSSLTSSGETRRCAVYQVDPLNYYADRATIQRTEELVMGYIAGYPHSYLQGGITHESIWLVCVQDSRCLAYGAARLIPRGFTEFTEKALPVIRLGEFVTMTHGIRMSIHHVLAVTYNRELRPEYNTTTASGHFVRLCLSIGTSAVSHGNGGSLLDDDMWWIEIPIDVANKAFRAYRDRALAAFDAGIDARVIAIGPDTAHLLSLPEVR